MERMRVVCFCIINDQNDVLEFSQNCCEREGEKKACIFAILHNRPHRHTCVRKASKYLTKGRTCRKAIRCKVLSVTCSSAPGLLQGPGLIYYLPDWWASEAGSHWPRSHCSQVWERLQPLAGCSTFAQWDVWQTKTDHMFFGAIMTERWMK